MKNLYEKYGVQSAKVEGTYKMVGFINNSGIIPNLVYPIFQGEDGKLYFAYSDSQKEHIIIFFYEVKRAELKKVKFLQKDIRTNVLHIKEVSVGSTIMFLFQTSKDFVHIGNYEQIEKIFENSKVKSSV